MIVVKRQCAQRPPAQAAVGAPPPAPLLNRPSAARDLSLGPHSPPLNSPVFDCDGTQTYGHTNCVTVSRLVPTYGLRHVALFFPLSGSKAKGGDKGGALAAGGADSQKSDIYKLVRMIMERNYDPVIVFSFSKVRQRVPGGCGIAAIRAAQNTKQHATSDLGHMRIALNASLDHSCSRGRGFGPCRVSCIDAASPPTHRNPSAARGRGPGRPDGPPGAQQRGGEGAGGQHLLERHGVPQPGGAGGRGVGRAVAERRVGLATTRKDSIARTPCKAMQGTGIAPLYPCRTVSASRRIHHKCATTLLGSAVHPGARSPYPHVPHARRTTSGCPKYP